ncbi:RICIN domain-containing protein [Micromonosporaceae bacterium Da 78-11]
MSLSRRVLTFLTVVLSLTGAGVLAGAPAQAADDEYYLLNANSNSNKAMVVLNARTNDNQPVIQWPSTNAAPDNDKMRLQYLRNSNEYFIRAVHSNKCVVVQNASFALYARIIQFTCSDDNVNNNDIWLKELIAVRIGSTDYKIPQWRNKASRLCIAVLSGSTDNGAELVQYTCNQSLNSLWKTSVTANS